MTHRRAASSWRRAAWSVGVAVIVAGVLLGSWVGSRVQGSPSGAATAEISTVDDAADDAADDAVDDAVDDAAGSQLTQRGATERRNALVPVRLEVRAIGVSTRVVRLGLTPDHTVEVPDADDAGWFQPGPTPGARGSAVILGHVDSPRGPAVFARLQELRPGDRVSVERAGGSTASFVVERSVLYANADFPAARVYADRGGRRLNLVTCGGSYDSSRGGYQSNLVVYTRRVDDPLRD